MTTGKALSKEWNVGVCHALYRKTGDWYHQLSKFPGALFDENGYVIFNTKEEFVNCPYLQIKQQVNVPQSISTIPGYVQFIKPLPISKSKKETVYFEGTGKSIKLTIYEREPKARQECLRCYGFSCCICTFNFEEKYGSAAKNVIHVHHLTPLSDIGDEYVVNPISDLRPVCPNCHAVIHAKKPPFSIEEVKEMLLNKSEK